jgi:hypothetical protein
VGDHLVHSAMVLSVYGGNSPCRVLAIIVGSGGAE